ncbi:MULTISPECIES: 4-(cytidine 5'-diphospho)-2-C-methyl-D-erythritol kinase [unclassified Sphingomonas]|uniref:4-(cytidine 5'-diphospho)-2-C-methyl-D-erythritol kinase n=1 Tax=unclassified Sphingomonas TaxID=196159 RepID=UPI0006FD7216|nr:MULTISPECIES: 4-(cytidine 5'-diphospho)-2-C-methyl-D-erythritol kinase [unclassified Sphingomonas]KQX22664.1 4-diphosphocytidyl-2C-methyl-D-erythritol kinase [Sphingomonas sp. Root1294]KQY67857.1 4-diphosphocytidyl-2C-methyl-D-erythritol kinase [Sphingomonas sp. Root50]KRB88780.1 4-diphosphocytidyl-2C-methyl-D-erythritol kinase [Sphingomonas sp. Root720]
MPPAAGDRATRSTETAYAKINLALHVRRRRADGYHDIETIFAFAEEGDRVGARPGTARLTLSGPFAAALAGADPEDNLVIRAARALCAAIGGAPPPAIALDKRLPVAAGIGGGSADAAAVLRLLCRDRGIAPDDPRVTALAAELGADVPACLRSTLARGDGRGDALEAVEAGRLAGMPLLLVNPRVALPTGPVFAAWDGVDRGPLAPGDPLAAALAGRNDLEPPARALHPVIGDVVALLAAQSGAMLARMSGSGATCFGLFASQADRDAADRAIAARRPDWWRLASRLR